MSKKFIGWLILATVAVLLGAVWVAGSRDHSPTISYSQFLDQVRAGQVLGVVVLADDSGATPATVRLRDGSVTKTVLPQDYRDALSAMQSQSVNIEIRDVSSLPARMAMKATPFFVLLAIWLILFGRMRHFPGWFR